MPTKAPPTPVRDVLEVDWPFFGELCRALALRVAASYDPAIVEGIAKAGGEPGARAGSLPGRRPATPGPRSSWRGARYASWDRPTCARPSRSRPAPTNPIS